MQLIGYIRVSRTNGRKGQTFISPGVQRDAIQAWADAHGHVIAEWIEEMDRSAGSGKRRPEFDKAMAQVLAGKLDGFIVYRFSRFGRSLIEAALRIQKVEDKGRVVESATEGDQSKLTRNIMLAIAEDELDRLTETWGEAQRRAVKRGVWIAPAPLGYVRDKDGLLELHEATWRIVREAFRIAASDGLHSAAEYLKRELPDKRWRTADVRRVLSNRAYLGEHHSPDGDAHPAVVDLEMWTAAQTEPQARRSNGDYPLSGIATCQCGSPLVGALQSVHGRRYRRMRCSNPACRGGSSISADKLETYVRETLAGRLGDRRFRVRLAPAGVDEARETVEMAETALRAYLGMGDIVDAGAFRAGARDRQRTVDEARERYQALAGQDVRSETLPAAGELHKPEQFLRAVHAAVIEISVRPGRGAVEDRVTVRLVGDKFDDGANVLAA